MLNVLAVISDIKPWPDGSKHSAARSKGEVIKAFEGWHPTVTKIAGLMPEAGDDGGKFGEAIEPIFYKMWNYDVEGMVGEAVVRLDAKI